MPENPSGLEPLLTRHQVADWLSISLRTLALIRHRRFAGRPPLRPMIETHMCVRYDPGQVREWLASGSEPTDRRKRGRPRKYRPGSAGTGAR